MPNTLDVILNRRSVRAYSDQPITLEEKDLILQATLRAPTAGNLMLYSIIEVEDQNLKERLAVTCDNQPFIARAPWVLIFLADYQRWFDIFTHSGVEQHCQELGQVFRTPQAGDLMLAACDALIAAQTAVIAAESLGITSCYIGDILENYETHRQLLDLPPYTLPITMLCFGRPVSKKPAANPTPRYERQYIVHKNSYRRLGPEDIDRMLRPSVERYFSSGNFMEGAKNIGQHTYLRKFGADFSKEMNRSVLEMLKNWD